MRSPNFTISTRCQRFSVASPALAMAVRCGTSAPDELQSAFLSVSQFLSDSRAMAERAHRCKASNCAFLCTGLSPSHCCKLCARMPGQHGPKCKRKMLACSSPGCGYAVTGLAAAHCCKKCAAGNGEHGPHCWHLPVEEPKHEAADAAETLDAAASATDGVNYEENYADAAELEPVNEEAEERECLELDEKIEGNEVAIRSNEELIQFLQQELAAAGAA